tara:strand:+ start:104 stop:427 length:324 start_codon:yes stop_codon:yes gene_type:complete
MSVVRKSSSASRVTTKPAANDISVVSIRNPSRMEEMGDTGFGTLNESKDGMVVSYDNSTNRFILISPDDLLETSVEDNDLPDTFISTLESEIDLGQIDNVELDGGAW